MRREQFRAGAAVAIDVIDAESELRRSAVRLRDAKAKVLEFQTTHKLLDPLARTIKALRLVGAQVLLSGIQPDIAVRFADAAIDLQGTRCFIDLASALAAGDSGARRQ